MSTVIRVENVSKRYRLGVINRGMLYQDLQSRWARWRGKEDPNSSVLERRPDEHTRAGRDDFWALRDVSFEVKDGDSVGIIGHNGAGKSTLLKILSEITTPTSGCVKMRGRVASLLEVGTGFHPELTGRENVYLNGAILGMTRAEVTRKFGEIVEFSGVEKFIDTPVKRYSSGMRVRLAFAVAAHLDPEILIVDEVLAVGDVSFQEKCLGKMKSIAETGRTVLFVSHNTSAICSLTRRCLFLESGRLMLDGETNAVMAEYLHRETESTVGDISEFIQKYRRNKELSPIAFIKSISVNERYPGQAKLGLNEPVTLNISLEVGQKLQGAYFCIIIRDSLEAPVLTLFSWDQDCALRFEPGQPTISVSFPNVFAPGTYFCDLGVSQNVNATAFDIVYNLPLFKIVNLGTVRHWPDRIWGKIHFEDVCWKLLER